MAPAVIDDDDVAQQFLICYWTYPSWESVAYRTASAAAALAAYLEA